MKKIEMNRRDFLEECGKWGMASFIPFGTLTSASAIAAEEAEAPVFLRAKPVWGTGREKEMNVTLSFTAKINIDDPAGSILRSTGSTMMRIRVNGEFTGYGPARGPHTWYRIDEWDISPKLKKGSNVIQIEVMGYNSNSFYTLDQPSFLQAEIVNGKGEVLAFTAPDAPSPSEQSEGNANTPSLFSVLDETGRRLQKVQRFSFQRPFIEVYDFRHPYGNLTLSEQPEVKYLPRRVPYPEFAILKPAAWLKRGKLTPREIEKPWRDRSLTGIGPKLKGYKLGELEITLSDDIQRFNTELLSDTAPLELGQMFHEGDAQIVDFGANLCGFFGFDFAEIEPGSEIILTFDEILTNEDVNFLRLGTCSAVKWTLNGTERNIEAFEPEVGRYAKIHCIKGSFKLRNFYLREYAFPEIKGASFSCTDPRLEKLFKAGILTYRENAVDAFTDCPHRERAGWLCDSFFTARTAFDLTGKTDIEDAFYENYMLPESFKALPDGMLPMCYPADHYNGEYIPNWSLWFVVELAEYAHRTADQAFVTGLQKRVEKLMTFFSRYENSDGLLEKLESWVFVEWSEANSFVQDVNYPSNMLYAAALDGAGKLYNKPEWVEKAAAIRKKIVEQSFDGEFFVDNALRKEDGSLEITRNRTEVCQYFAFFFGTATPESHPELWARLLNDFGPNRITEGKYPEVHKANSFVGNVVRLELLSQANRGEQLLEESVAYNEYMADLTGTLWENDGAYASCNHGFASHICRVLFRDVAGIAEIDIPAKSVKVKLQKFSQLDRASAIHPVPGGTVSLNWEIIDGKRTYKLEIPKGWKSTVEEV